MTLTFSLWDDKPKKRKTVPKKLLRRIVWERDKGICQVCHKKVNQFDWELGHNRARSRGGAMNAKNTYVAHSSCNRSQQTLSLKSVHRIIGAPETEHDRVKRLLNCLTMGQLKDLAQKQGIKLHAKVRVGFWEDIVARPGKKQYVNALSKVVSLRQVHAQSRKKT